jgi:hypothetical protein
VSRLKQRIEKIERKLHVGDKGPCLRFPDGKGSFIKAPGCRSLIDVLAIAMAWKKGHFANNAQKRRKATKCDDIQKNRVAQ